MRQCVCSKWEEGEQERGTNGWKNDELSGILTSHRQIPPNRSCLLLGCQICWEQTLRPTSRKTMLLWMQGLQERPLHFQFVLLVLLQADG